MIYFLATVSVLNLLCLFVLGAYIVRFRERVDSIFSEVIDAMENMWGTIPPVQPTIPELKTWDQKYEEEIETFQRRMRQETGLLDPTRPE